MTPAAGATVPTASEPRVAILMYHSFAERAASRELRPLTIPPSLFAEQLGAMVERGIRLATVEEVPGLLSADADDGPTAVISIDDAFADVLNAVDTLVANRAPATLFVPTQYVGRAADWMADGDDPLPILGWSELAGLRDAGVELASHGHRHIAADVNPPRAVLDDARRSLVEFEDHLGVRPLSFGYPFGHENRAARRAVREAGFQQACAIRHVLARPRDDRFALPRVYVGPDHDAETLVRMITEPRAAIVEHALRTVSRLRISVRRVAPVGPAGSRRVHSQGVERPRHAPSGGADAAPAPDEPFEGRS